jgi:ParB family chromosome partitioning protein
MKKTKLELLPSSRIVTLKRNPQFLTPKQMESLKASIKRDGFCAPILVRPLKKNRFEVVSGNHRFMAACELGLKEIPCVVSRMDDRSMKRLAVNLNTIHGDPNAELLAPFLAELDLTTLREIHIEDDMKKELMEFDDALAKSLSELEAPEKMNYGSRNHKMHSCKCPTCGAFHSKATTKV